MLTLVLVSNQEGISGNQPSENDPFELISPKMMSNPPSSLHSRQNLHRRQNSTPIGLEAVKVQHPTTMSKQTSPHRRGQSQDSRSPIRRQLHQRTGSMVSITNLGSTPQGQQILREAQQQRIPRPGQQLAVELPTSPQCGMYQQVPNSSLPTSPYGNMPMNAAMQQQHAMPTHSQHIQHEMQMPLSAGLSLDFSFDENNQHYFQNAHQMQQYAGAMPLHDRRMSQPELRIQTGMRPITPAQQIQIAQFPLTPATTPFRHQPIQYARSLQASPTQQFHDENIRSPYPISMQKSRSLQGIVEQDEMSMSMPIYGFEVADMPSFNHDREPTKRNIQPRPARPSEKKSPKVAPEQESLPFFDENGGKEAELEDTLLPILTSSKTDQECHSPSRPALSPRRMSISDLNLDPGISASIEETNVTLDDIAQFIEGPDPKDNKWVCKYEDCNKKFGRKENIKSHVQTHLGDRQFRCDHCQKCFVRGHDLKRHAKIHTGTKPYPCLCGNAFARHDALTRHRQRGMCIGAFDGIVKKVIKRGRPRKHRPEMDDRVGKAMRTRRNQADNEYGQDQYTSSGSSCSLSSWGSPPTETMDALSLRGQSPYEDFGLFPLSQQMRQDMSDNLALPPDMFSFTPPASPGYSCGNKPSPSYRELTPAEIASISGDISQSLNTSSGNSMTMMDDLPTMTTTSNSLLTANPMAIQRSQQSLPSLSHSSSSPAADIVAFDFGSDDPTMSSMQSMGIGMGMNMKMEDRNEFDTFLDYGGMEMGLDNGNSDSFFTM